MGPYKFDHWDRNQQLVYTRNENYWGKKPHFTKVICKFVKDLTVSYSMIKAGELDISSMNKPQAELALKDEKFMEKFGVEVSIANQFMYVGWNMRRDLFKGEKTRRALTMLLDRQRVCDKIMRGFAIPIDIPAHPQSAIWPKSVADKLKIPFDVEGAKRLLAEDGWKDTDGDNVLDRDFGDGKRTPFKFTLKLPSGSPEYESIANLMQDAYAQAGIVMTIQNLEWSVLVQSMERLTFDAVISGWRLGTSDDPYQLWHSSQTGEKASNHCGFVDKKVDELIEMGRCELDPAKRNPMFQEVFARISQAQPYTCLFVGKRTIAYDKRIQNIVYTLQGKDIMRWWVPKEKQKYK